MSKAITSNSSRTACPAIKSGPVMKPRCELSLIVAVRSGPGIRAPESAIIKDEIKIVTSMDQGSFPSASFASSFDW